MGKRLQLVIMALILVMSAIVPTYVLAAPNNSSSSHNIVVKSTRFTSQASLAITSAGTPTITKTLGPLFFEKTVNEQISATIIASQGWDALAGASFTMDSISDDAVLNMAYLNLTGVATGTITLTKGTSMMTGTYSVIIRGKFILDAGNPVFYEVNDIAQFNLTSGSGVFKGIEAEGVATVQLSPISTPFGPTLGGLMTMTGKID